MFNGERTNDVAFVSYITVYNTPALLSNWFFFFETEKKQAKKFKKKMGKNLQHIVIDGVNQSQTYTGAYPSSHFIKNRTYAEQPKIVIQW